MNAPDRSPLPPELLETCTARLLDADPTERSAVCEELVRRHPEHRAALERLLMRIGGAERLLAASFPTPSVDFDPVSIAGHQVVRRLGQGAFGTVFLCQQQRPVARLVAIKVARHSGDADVLRRFDAERQLLASMSHPAIAQIHDAGSLPDGRPYFVMEFVDGLPIAEFCASQQLSTELRLRLFVQLCRGVEHAHGRGVVHRDLKPGNVLVLESAGAPQPKIIDFGIAKALCDASTGERLVATETGRVMGTPGYMSPEQAMGQTDRIDARTDVFALGVILYELLTNDLPWPRGVLHATETEPALPSVRITKNARRARGSDGTRRLAAQVRGDLDWITMKAVRRERDERYASVRELADDVERHLAGRPVHAGPPSFVYRLKKFVRRQRVATVTLGVAFATVAIVSWAAHWRTQDAAERSHARQTQARAAIDRLLQRSNDATMQRTPQNEALRRELAGDALAFYDALLAEKPDDPQARLGRCNALITLSEVHTVLGQVQEALRTADEAAAEARALLAGDAASVQMQAIVANATRRRVKAMHLDREFAASMPYCEVAAADLERCAAKDPARYAISFAQALRDIALAHQMLGANDASLAAGRRSVAVLDDLIKNGIAAADARADLVWARFVLGGQLVQMGQPDEAETTLAAAAHDLDAITSDRERIAAAILAQQGQLSWQRGDVDAAITRLTAAEQACDAWRQREPNRVRALLTQFQCVRQLARALEQRGDFGAARAAMQRTIDVAVAKAAAFPEDSQRVHDQRIALYEFGRALWNRFRRTDLAQSHEWLSRCVALSEAAVLAGGLQRPLHWEARSVQLLVADADGRDTAAAWEELAAELPRARDLGAEEPAQQAAEAWLGLTRSRARRGAWIEAAAALECAGHYAGDVGRVDSQLRSEAAGWRARIAIENGDAAAASAAVAELLALRGSWWGHWRAGDCEFAAWRALVESNAAVADVHAVRERAAQRYRTVIEALQQRVADAPLDPWLAVPMGLSAIGLGAIEFDRGEFAAARRRLDAALAMLAEVEADAHRDLFDESRVALGRELLARLAAESR